MAEIPTTGSDSFEPDAPDSFEPDAPAPSPQAVSDIGTSRHSFAAGIVRDSDALLTAKAQAEQQQFDSTWNSISGPAPSSSPASPDAAPFIYPQETRAVFAANAADRRQQAADDAQRLKTMFELAPKTDADNEVQVQQLARAMGVSSDTVRDNLSAWKSFGDVAGWDADEWTRRNPELTRAMLGDARVGLSTVVWKERNPLEKLVAAIKRPFNSFFAPPDVREVVRDNALNPADRQAASDSIAASDKRAEEQYQADISPRPVEQVDNQQAKEIREGGSIAGVALTALTGGVLGDPRLAGIAAQRAIEAHHGMQSSRLWAKYAVQRAAEQLDVDALKGDTEDTLARAREEEALATPLYLGDNQGGLEGFAGDVGGGSVATVEQQAIRFGSAGVGGAAGAAVGAAGGAGLAVLAGQPELAGIAAEEGASAGFSIGVRGGFTAGSGLSAADMAITEGGAMAQTLYEQKDETGATLDPVTILGASTAAGLVNMLLEGMGSEASAGKLAKDAFAGRIRRDPTLRALLKRLAVERLKDTGTEMWTEPMQDIVRETFAYLGQGVQAGSFDDAKWNYSEGDALQASWGALAGSLPFGGGQTAVELATARINNDARKSAAEALPDIITMAGTQTAQAHPEAFAQVVADATASGGHPAITSLHVDGDEALRLYQQGGTEAREALTQLWGPDAATRVQEAAASGLKLEVPMAQVPDFFASEMGKALKDSTTADPTSLSPRQQKTHGAEVEKAAQQLFDAAVKELQAGQSLEASLKASEDGAAAALEEKLGKRQARQVARSQTALVKAFMASQSEKAGKSVTELFRAAPITFKAGDNQATQTTVDDFASAAAADEAALAAAPEVAPVDDFSFDPTALDEANAADAQAAQEAATQAERQQVLADFGLNKPESIASAREYLDTFKPSVSAAERGAQSEVARRAAQKASLEQQAARKQAMQSILDVAEGKATAAKGSDTALKEARALLRKRFGVVDNAGLDDILRRARGGIDDAADFRRKKRTGPVDETKRQEFLKNVLGRVSSTRVLRQEVTAPDSSAVRALRSRFDGLAQEQRTQEFYVDTTTGVLNRRAFDRIDPAGRQFAVIAVEGVKYSNDTAGHDAGNAVYRAAAQAAAPHVQQLAKIGGDFGAFVESDAALQESLERVNENPALRGYQVVGGAGPTLEAAFTEMRRRVNEARAAGTYAERGQRPVNSTVPEGEALAVGKVAGTEISQQLREKLESTFGPERQAEQFAATYTEATSGLLTKDGFDRLERKAFIASFDFNGVAEYDGGYRVDGVVVIPGIGKLATDRLIIRVANMIREQGGPDFDAAHVSGDEFLFQSDDRAALTAFFEKLRTVFSEAVVPLKTDGGRPVEVVGLFFGVGVGENIDDAETELNADKVRLSEGDNPVRGPGLAVKRLRYPGSIQGADAGGARGVEGARPAGDAASVAGVGGSDGGAAVGGAPGGEPQSAEAVAGGGRLEQRETTPRWHSAVEKAIQAAKQAKNSGAAWWALLSKTPGVKAEELEWLGLKDFLDKQKGSVSREDVLAFAQAQRVEVTEKQLSQDTAEEAAARAELERVTSRRRAAFDAQVDLIGPLLRRVGGAQSWRLLASETRDDELALLGVELNEQQRAALANYDAYRARERELERILRPRWGNETQYGEYTLPGEKQNYRELLFSVPQSAGYSAPHFGAQGKGLLAHARVDERTLASGEKALFVEEVQSDLHQTGREKGYTDAAARLAEVEREMERVNEQFADADESQRRELEARFNALADQKHELTQRVGAEQNRAPAAPFADSWENLVAKRMVMEAVHLGLSKIAWTTGTQQADRYNLQKSVGSIGFNPETRALTVMGAGTQAGPVLEESNVSDERLVSLLGKDLAKRLIEAPVEDGEHLLTGDGLKLGGEGMKAAYDVRIPSVFRALVKKYGGTVQREALEAPGESDSGVADIHSELARMRDDRRIITQAIERQGAAATTDRDRGFIEELDRQIADAERRLAAKTSQVDVWSVTIPDALANLVRSEGLPLFATDERGAPKGYTSAHPEMEAMEGVVTAFLNKNADASTVIHEGAHGFLGWLQHLAAQPDATEATKQQWASTTKALTGRTLTGEEFNALPEAERVAAHEKFARSFEQYVMEGKAPSAGLKRAFAAFSRWLLRIYAAVKTVPESQLNDDMRAVFDAMLTTQAEVKRARQQQGPRVATTQQQREEEDDDYTEGSYAQQLRAVKDALRRNEAWWKAEVKARAQEFSDAWEKLPAVQARKHLEAAGVVLDRRAVDAVLKGRKLKGVRTVMEGGVKPDVFAALFNFGTGEEMLKALATLPASKEAWVDAQVDGYMREKFPGVLDNMDEFRRQLAGDLHAATVKRVMSETKVTPAQRAAAEKAAELLVQRRTVRALRPEQALRAQRMAAEKKAAAMAKGDAGKAMAAAQQELLNLYLHKALLDAVAQVEKFDALAGELRKPAAVKRLGKAAPVYRDAVALVLGELGLGPAVDVDAGVVRLAVNQMNGDAVLIGDPEWLELLEAALESGAARTTNRKGEEVRDFRGLTFEQMQAAHDALLTLRAAARQRTTAIVGDKRVEISDFREQLKAEARENKEPVRPVGEQSAAAIAQRAAHRITGPLLKIETILDWLGGSLVRPGKELNSAWHSLFVMLESARQREVDVQHRYAEPVMKAFRDLPADVANSFGTKVPGRELFPTHRLVMGLDAGGAPRYSDEELTPPSTVGEIFLMLLNAGNEENLQRLCDGRNITPEQVYTAFNRYMTPAHIEAANAIGEAFESMWPEIQAMEERISGVKPKGVEKRPLQLKAGLLRGHYFPAVYDPRVAGPGITQSEQAQADAVASLFSPVVGRPQTTHGHRQSRAQVVYGAINLSPGGIATHLAQHAHDLAFYERVGDVWRILDDRELRGVMNARLGHRRAEQVYQWVKDAARVDDLRGSVAGGGFFGFVRKMQANQTLALLGYSVPNAVEDSLASLTVFFDRDLQPSFYAKGLLGFFSPGSGGWDALAAKSKGLATAEASAQAALSRELKRIDQSSNPVVRGLSRARDVIQAHAFGLNEVVFRFTAGPAWLGRYQQALADGAEERQAQEAANALVRRNWPSFHAVNAAGVSRDVRIRPFVPFYGYFSTVLNKRLDEAQRIAETPGGADKARAAGRLLGFTLVASLLAPWVKEMVRTRGKGSDEPPEEWALWALLQGELGMVPFGGDVANMAHQMWKGLRPSPRGSAVTQLPTQALLSLQALAGDAPTEWKAVKTYLDTVGLAYGLPTSTVKFSVETAQQASGAE